MQQHRSFRSGLCELFIRRGCNSVSRQRITKRLTVPSRTSNFHGARCRPAVGNLPVLNELTHLLLLFGCGCTAMCYNGAMVKFLAIDWDETECRYAIATLQSEKITVQDVGIVPVESLDGSEFATPIDALATAIYSFCKEEKIGSCPLLISLGRNDVEWIQQKLPPCKETEIPLLLRNQILREISGSTEADPLDYLLLKTTDDGHRILALMISQTFRKSLMRTFRSLGYPPTRIGFRAGNVAELVLRNPTLLDGEPTEPKMIVDVVGNDADLIVVAEGRIIAVRSFRLPAEHQQKNLAEEIERTLTIGWEEDDLVPIQHVILFGDGTNSELPKHLSQSGLAVQFLNPFTLPNVSVAKCISDPEKFAPLIGSFLIQSQKIKPVIDFLHPKEAPKPPNYTRPLLLAFVLLGIICFGLYHWNRAVVNGMEANLEEIKEKHQQVDGELRHIMPAYGVLQYAQYWEAQNVVWLDVLKDLSEVLPSNTDLVVAQMTMATGPINNNPRFAGSITLSGMVRDPSVLQKLQYDLQSSRRYLVQQPSPAPNPAGGGYPWLFRTTIYRLRY